MKLNTHWGKIILLKMALLALWHTHEALFKKLSDMAVQLNVLAIYGGLTLAPSLYN